MLVIDDFLPASVREDALRSRFIDWDGPDGETYRRICIKEIPGLREAVERVMGPVRMLGMAYRLNFAGEVPNHAIHSDMGWGTHALVVYLSDGPGGTALWRHKATGAHRIDPGDWELFEAVKGDWDDASRWEQAALTETRLGRGVIYESALFHSRWPFEAYGSGLDDGRLIAVAFFTPEG